MGAKIINSLKGFIEFAKQDYRNLLLIGVIMVSAIIVFMGIIKPLYKKIKNDKLRDTALGFSSIALVFLGTAIWFLIKHISFSYYLIATLIICVWLIVTYWLYAKTQLRTLIEKIGRFTLSKVLGFIKNFALNWATNQKAKEIDEENTKMLEEYVKNYAETQIKETVISASKNKDLENL